MNEGVRGTMRNRGSIVGEPAKTREEMTELERAKVDVDYWRHRGGFGYKQAKKHYERLLRRNGGRP